MNGSFLQQLEKWLLPGVLVKRWALVLIIGLIFLFLGINFAIPATLTGHVLTAAQKVTLGPEHYTLRSIVFLTLGVPITLFAAVKLYRAFISSMVRVSGPSASQWIGRMYEEQRLSKGPRIVAIGGGTGLPVLLRGLKSHTSNITAVVTVADDGGSSGRLRRELGVIPPGDFRNCLVALADTESLMNEVMQYRFSDGEELRDHAFGNLLLATLTKVTGDFALALEEVTKLLRVRGRILPSTLTNVTLFARTVDGDLIQGEAEIPHAKAPIHMVSLEPPKAKAYPPAVQAIAEADMVLLGPGSLYTSVMPNLLVSGIADSVRSSKAIKVYICNVVMQPGETDGYSVEDHYRTIARLVGPGLVDYILVNDKPISVRQDGFPIRPVPLRGEDMPGVTIVRDTIVDPSFPTRHESARLAASLIQLRRSKSRAKQAQRAAGASTAQAIGSAGLHRHQG